MCPLWRLHLDGSWSSQCASWCWGCTPPRAWPSGALCTPSSALLRRPSSDMVRSRYSLFDSQTLMGGQCVGLCHLGVGVSLLKLRSSVVTQPRNSMYRLLSIHGNRRCKTSPSRLAGVSCVVNCVTFCLYRVVPAILVSSSMKYDTPPMTYP